MLGQRGVQLLGRFLDPDDQRKAAADVRAGK